MVADLPEPLKQQVCDYLKADDFRAAKAIHDAWIAKKYLPEWDSSHTPT